MRGEEWRRRERVGEEEEKSLAGETFCRRERASSGFRLEEGRGELAVWKGRDGVQLNLTPTKDSVT